MNYADDYFDAGGNGNQVWAEGSYIGGTGDADGQAPFPAGTIVNQIRGGFTVNPGLVRSGASPLGEGVIVGQFTLNRGATLSGGISFGVEVRPNTLYEYRDLVVNGPAVMFQTAPGVFHTA